MTSKIPNEADLKQNSDYVQTVQNGNTVYEQKAQEFVREKEGAEKKRSTYIPSRYVYDSQGRLLRGTVYGLKVVFQKGKRLQQEAVPLNVYSRQGENIQESVYELISNKKGTRERRELQETNIIQPSGRSVQTEFRTNLTPTQKANRAYASYVSKAKAAGVDTSRQFYNSLTAKERGAIVKRGKRIQRENIKPSVQDVQYAGYLGAKRPQEPIMRVHQTYTYETVKGKGPIPVQQLDTKKEKRFGGIDIQPDKESSSLMKLESKAETFITRKAGSTTGLVAGVAFAGYKTGKGIIKGVIAPFRPSTYINLFKAVTNPKETVTALGGLGAEIQRDPTVLFEVGGQFYGFGVTQTAITKVARSIRNPSVLSRSGTSIQNVQLHGKDASVSVAKSSTLVKVGGKTFKVKSVGKELAITVDPKGGLQATFTRIKAASRGVKTTEAAIGGRVIQNGRSVGIEQAVSIVKQGRKTKIGSRSTEFVSREIASVQGLKSEVGASITQSSKLVKISKSALKKGKAPKKALKQTESSLGGSIGKEILAVDNVRSSRALTFTVTGKSALQSIRRAIDKGLEIIKPGKEANADALYGSLGAATSQTTKVSTKSVLVQNLERVAKQTAKQAFISEKVNKVPGLAVPNVVKTVKETKVGTLTTQKLSQAQEPTQVPVVKAATSIKIVQSVAPIAAIEPVTSSKSKTTTKQIPITESAQSQVQVQEPIVEQVTRQEPITIVRSNVVQKTQHSIFPRTQNLFLPRVTGQRKRLGSLFQTAVRRRGKFQSIGFFQTAEQAVTAGKTAIDFTPAASFKVAGNQSLVFGAARKLLSGKKYRQSKDDPNIFVEKSIGRIDTPGEILGITRKGLAALKFGKKNVFRR